MVSCYVALSIAQFDNVAKLFPWLAGPSFLH